MFPAKLDFICIFCMFYCSINQFTSIERNKYWLANLLIMSKNYKIVSTRFFYIYIKDLCPRNFQTFSLCSYKIVFIFWITARTCNTIYTHTFSTISINEKLHLILRIMTEENIIWKKRSHQCQTQKNIKDINRKEKRKVYICVND